MSHQLCVDREGLERVHVASPAPAHKSLFLEVGAALVGCSPRQCGPLLGRCPGTRTHDAAREPHHSAQMAGWGPPIAAAHQLRSLLNQSEIHPKHWNGQLIPCGPLSPMGPCAFPPKEAALLQATGQCFRLCSRWIQKGSRDQAPVGGRKCPATAMGRFEFRCVGPCSRNRSLCLPCQERRAWKGDTSHVLPFHLGRCPDRSGQRSGGGGSWGAVWSLWDGPPSRAVCFGGKRMS